MAANKSKSELCDIQQQELNQAEIIQKKIRAVIQLSTGNAVSSDKFDMQKLKQTFIGSMSCSSSGIRRLIHFERCRLLMLTVKLFLSSSRTEQDAEGYRLTMVWFHTTFGQTSQHDSAV